MKKPTNLTQQQLADDYSVSTATLRRARADCVDVQNRDEFADYIINTKAKRPHAWINGVPWLQEEKPETPHMATDEERDLMARVRNATDYNEARTLKTQIDSMYKLRQIQILEGDYIHKDEVIRDHIRIGSAMQAGLKQLAADLPAMIEGLLAAQSKKVIAKVAAKLMGSLSDPLSKLYK